MDLKTYPNKKEEVLKGSYEQHSYTVVCGFSVVWMAVALLTKDYHELIYTSMGLP